jgi:hypothetical protein
VSEFAQRFVSQGVAVRVVDHFEAIEVEHENGHPLRIAGATKTFIELFGEEAAVG